jgi:hypothetical protein
VRSIAIPSTGSNRLTLACDQVLEGTLSLSGNGRFITLAGYDADVGTANVRTSAASSVARVVGQLDLAGNFIVVARLNDGFDQDSVRGAATVDGTAYWLSGSGLNSTGGIRYAMPNATSSVLIAGNATGPRAMSIVGGQLYYSNKGGANANGIMTFGGTLPVSPLASTLLPGAMAFEADGFAAVDTDSTPGIDTLYVAVNQTLFGQNNNDKLRLVKFTLVGTTWTMSATFQPMMPSGTSTTWTPTNGLTAVKTATGVRVYVTTDSPSDSVGATGPTRLATFLDDGSTQTPVATILATAPAKTVYRGLALTPTP